MDKVVFYNFCSEISTPLPPTTTTTTTTKKKKEKN